MKILNARTHGAIDYVVVIFLWLSPTLFGLSAPVSTLVYALGAIHLLLTILTNFPFGIIKVLPFKIHGWVELIVGIVLLTTPFLLAPYVTSGNPIDIYFLSGFGVAVLLTWLITDYQ